MMVVVVIMVVVVMMMMMMSCQVNTTVNKNAPQMVVMITQTENTNAFCNSSEK